MDVPLCHTGELTFIYPIRHTIKYFPFHSIGGNGNWIVVDCILVIQVVLVNKYLKKQLNKQIKKKKHLLSTGMFTVF